MITVICLLRGADPALPAQIAARLIPGDRVILVDDSGDPQALTRARALTWPEHIAVTAIVTGTPAPGDGGIATNLALDRVITSHALVLEGAARLTGPLPRPVDRTLSLGPDPDLAQALFPVTALRRAEGIARSELGFLWALMQAHPVARVAPWAATPPAPAPA